MSAPVSMPFPADDSLRQAVTGIGRVLSGLTCPEARSRALARPHAPDTMDDESGEIPPSLLEGAREGDSEACRQLVVILQPMVARHVRNQIFRQSDHDDVVQEAFLKIFVKLNQYKGPQPFTHWVSRLTINTCYDWLRRQRARPVVNSSDLSDAERAALENTLAGQHESADEVRAELLAGLLERLLDCLKPREQIVIRLLDLEERSVAETAGLTGWSESKIKVTAFRARRKLADQLKRLESR